MIITCPACSTRYNVGDAAVSNRARKVRCAKCGHEWLIEAPETPDQPSARPSAPEPDEFVNQPDVETEPETKSKADFEDAAVRFRADTRRRPRPISQHRILDHILSLAIALVVLAVIAGGAWQFRVPIVRMWPAAASFYGALGIKVNALGLELSKGPWNIQKRNGLPVLTVSGTIKNLTSRNIAVPRLALTLRDNKERQLYHWSVELKIAHLKPGESAPFEIVQDNPPLEAHDVQIQFEQGG